MGRFVGLLLLFHLDMNSLVCINCFYFRSALLAWHSTCSLFILLLLLFSKRNIPMSFHIVWSIRLICNFFVISFYCNLTNSGLFHCFSFQSCKIVWIKEGVNDVYLFLKLSVCKKTNQPREQTTLHMNERKKKLFTIRPLAVRCQRNKT